MHSELSLMWPYSHLTCQNSRLNERVNTAEEGEYPNSVVNEKLCSFLKMQGKAMCMIVVDALY